MSKDDNLLCRTFNHQWDVIGRMAGTDIVEPPKKLDVSRLVELHLRCARCGTNRFDYIHTDSGFIRRRRYVYVDGYLLPKGEPRPLRPQYRLQVLTLSLRSLRPTNSKKAS